jgi:hypothetical protein
MAEYDAPQDITSCETSNLIPEYGITENQKNKLDTKSLQLISHQKMVSIHVFYKIMCVIFSTLP